jgi:hypothetical protein
VKVGGRQIQTSSDAVRGPPALPVWIAPWHSRFCRSRLGVWPGPFPLDAPYYAATFPAWPSGLPNEEIVSRALPEGVLDPGGRVDGFLYLRDRPRGTQLTFLAALVDASTGQPFGTVQIPFVVK